MPLVLYVACACFLVTVGAVCPAGQAPTLSGGCAPCRPGTHKAAAGSAACTGCVIGSDSAAGSAECECHAGYVYSASGDACIACPAGTHYSGQQCKPCPVDTYSETRAALTVDVCQRCPPLSNAPAGSVDRFACSCKAGSGGPSGGPCVGCVAGSYKTLFSSGIVDGSYSMSVGVCILCPAGSISVPGGHLVASCRCRPGFIGDDGGPCTPCEADTAKAHTGPGTCTPCPGHGQIVDNIVTNFSEKGLVRIELAVTMPYGEDFPRVESIIMDVLRNTPGVLEEPAPAVGIETFDSHNIVLTVRPYVNPDDYWPVTFAVNRNIKAAFNSHNVQVSYSEGIELGPIGK